MKKINKKKSAISLIVLVITILVLSILAATVIISLYDTNIISEANDAVKKTEEQRIEEAKNLMYADGILGNNPDDIVIGDITLRWDEENKRVIEVKANTENEGVIIPGGFYYVGGTKDTGLVISDNSADENKGVSYTCKGNQFVWVPVDDYSTFATGTAVKNSDGVYKMTGDLDERYTEPSANGYETEQAEYDAMCASVKKYGGFYIARFEAGDGDATEERTGATEAHTVVSKKGAYVYNYVPWGVSMSDIGTTGAVYLSQRMYKNHPSVVSTLCYGVQWDATMNFVSDAEHNIIYSSSWGNHSSSTGDATTDSGETNMNYTTGRNEAWKAKNIYDLAGNVQEWTMEESLSIYRVLRGGCYSVSAVAYSVNARGNFLPENFDDRKGFRPALYIK